MKYLFMVYADTQAAGGSEAFEQACRASEVALQESGYLETAVLLQKGSPASILRLQKGDLSLTDSSPCGPQGQLAALYFIIARDLNEAIRLAAGMPQARRGPIEVRAIMEGGGR